MFLKRILGFFIDWMIFFMVATILLLFGQNFKIEYLLYPSIKMFYVIGIVLYAIWFIVYPLFKDLIFKNASIGKKLFKLHIVDSKNEVPRKSKMILRNITFFIAPIEILLILLNNGIRLGDIIADTKVIAQKESLDL